MTVTINGTTGIDKVQDAVVQNATLAAGVPSTAKLPAGTVLQVVNTVNTTSFSTTSNSYQDTGISLSITPTSSTSKILVTATPTIYQSENGQGQVYIYSAVAVYRGASLLIEKPMSVNTGTSAVNDLSGTITLQYLDSPSTTSQTTYKLYIKSINLAFTTNINWANWPTTITLMEIAA